MAKQTTKQTSTTKKATKKETKPEVAAEVIETKENIVESTEESEKIIIDSDKVGMEEPGVESPEITEPGTTEPEPEKVKVENADDPGFNAVDKEVAEKREDLDIIKIDHNDGHEKKNVFVAKPLCAGNRYHQKVIVKKYPK